MRASPTHLQGATDEFRLGRRLDLMTARWRLKLAQAGASLRNPNFRRYMVGQSVSHSGQWLQQTAELWLILELTGSATALGVHAVLRNGPTVFFGFYGGLLGERFDRRRLLIATQILHLVGAVVLTIVTWAGSPSVLVVYLVVVLQGLVNSVDNPLRRTFVRDLVDDGDLKNAVSLNSTVGTVSRTVGPALAGLLISTIGIAWCFAINAISFLAVLASLFTISVRHMRPQARLTRERGQIREGFKYAAAHPRIGTTLILTAVVSVFAWNWHTLLPVYSTAELGGDAALFGAMVSALSGGSVLAALVSTTTQRADNRYLLWAGAGVSVSLLATALAPTILVAFIGVIAIGATGTTFTIGAQTRLQMNVEDAMTSRVMAMYSVSWIGSRPVGGLIGGSITDATDSRMAFLFGAFAVAIMVGWSAFTRRRRNHSPG